jgi:hypothetical protein
MTSPQPLTKMQIKRLMERYDIQGELSGSGLKWEAELADDATAEAFQEKVLKVGGYRCGHGGWVLRPGYEADMKDYCDKSSTHHY